MAARPGPTPLFCIDAVALDLETTSLDPSKARIVQIGALAIVRGRIASEQLSMLVNPGVPIPPTSTAVHGIGDHDVRGARPAGEAVADLVRFANRRPLIGHSIGYDIAVLDAEAKRVGAEPWHPTFLDTRLLGEIVAPSLPDLTLETLSAWLELEIDGRHTAIGDARAAAKIFSALIPHLRTKGIRTWAEAEAACRALPHATAGVAEGWAEPPHLPPGEVGALARVESYAYRHRVGEAMRAPARFVEGDTSLLQAVREMSEQRISSVFTRHEGGIGILTERDVLRALAAGGPAALDDPVSTSSSRPLESVRADAFLYRALGRMGRLKVRHLGVTDAEGQVVGALSARDLLRLRASEAIELGDAIETAEDIPALAAAWAMVPHVAESLLAEEVDGIGVAAVISDELGAATHRASELAEQTLAAEGEVAPSPYAVLVLGSAGRGESMLALDQDNAIVFESGEPGGAEDRYFAKLGARLADTLDAVGVPYCKGGVMAREENWRGSLDTWRARIAGWLSRSNPEDLLSVDIFFDARPVHGAFGLADAVISGAHSDAARAPQFIKLLAAASPQPPSPFGILGGFRTEAGRLDLKRMALLQIVSAARVLAMRRGIAGRSTQERLMALAEEKRGGEEDFSAVIAAHRVVVGTILRQQVRDIHAGVPPSNRVEIARLSGSEQRELKAALKVAPRLDDLVRDLLF